MSTDRFEATFVVRTDSRTAWTRLTERSLDSTGESRRLWLPGFDSSATITDCEDGAELHATKDDEPCAGTNIVVMLVDVEHGTQITVVQSGFGDWMPPLYDVMAVGWRHIVADLATYLNTGVNARRHLRPWGDLGANVSVDGGALRIHNVRPDTLADRLTLRDDDLLVGLAGAPVSCHDDLATVLRTLLDRPGTITAELVRDNTLLRTEASALSG
jgi:hypothetical protein